ncbi:hypothetical protein [Micromonospora sp. NPDC023956]|uniref:deoxynucleotide monophosphate kinase family protein n=1 Tax=Micromonospora sp. NPDC023956 TaxID=3155722 RepID=UPI0033CFEE40
MTAPIVGLIGRKRVGKDTVAARLVQTHGYRRHAFADKLRDAALALDPIVVGWQGITIRLSEVVRAVGWEVAKDKIPEVRRTLQNYGVAIRAMDEDFWVRPVLSSIAADLTTPAVVTDVRFPNEARAIVSAGGVLVRVVRPGLDESDTHESETALVNYPTVYTLDNTATIERLYEQTDGLAAQLRRR